MALTDTKIKNLKVPKGKNLLKTSDGGSLVLLVKPSGKYWQYAYRFAGK